MKKGMISFKAVGVDYTLRLGLGALDEYEETYGENSIKVLSALEDPEKDPAQYIRPLVNLFMVATKPRIADRAAARDLLDEMGVDEFISILTRASNAAFLGSEDPDAAEDKKPGNAKPGKK